MAEIVLSNVSKRYPGGVEAVRNLDLTIEDGEFFILVGPSGCGKSSVLNMIVGLEDPSEGEIRVDGKSVTGLDPKDRNMAMVFQSYAIYPHMTVRANMEFPLRLAKLGEEERDRRVEEAAKILELEELLDRRPESLSGGQRQRVAMGRAIVREPVAFLLDEPLSNLDAKLRAQMRTEIARLQRRLGTTMVYVTHDQAEAMTLGDHIAVLRRGRLQQVGTPKELYQEPRNLFVAGFIGSPPTNFLPARVEEGRLVLPMAEVPLPQDLREAWTRNGAKGGNQGDGCIAGIRPEDLHLVDAGPERTDGSGVSVFRASVDLLEWMGADVYVHFDVETGRTEELAAVDRQLRELTRDLELEAPRGGRRRFTARVGRESRAAEGEPVHFRIDPESVLLFDPGTGKRVTSD